MKYGCCVNILPKSGPKTGIEYVQKLKDIGYDYVELPLNELSKLSNAEFDSFLLALQGIGFPCLCCNDFMPSSFRIVGEKLTSTKELQNYLELAMARPILCLEALGLEIVQMDFLNRKHFNKLRIFYIWLGKLQLQTTL